MTIREALEALAPHCVRGCSISVTVRMESLPVMAAALGATVRSTMSGPHLALDQVVTTVGDRLVVLTAPHRKATREDIERARAIALGELEEEVIGHAV